MRIADVLLADYDTEIRSAQRLFERLPSVEKADWKPHEKSMLFGKLVMLVATLPGFGAMVLSEPILDMAQGKIPSFAYESPAQASAVLAETAAKTRTLLANISDEEMETTWQLKFHDRVFFTGSRILAYRTMFFNHFIHHRAQLGVYLRLLEVPIPGMYGPSADEQSILG
jgi:uncharacterized damage-inducible protein DinB